MDIDLQHVRVTVDRDEDGPYVCTTFPEGAQVTVRSTEDSWNENRLRDLLHSLIAEARGDMWSPSLWNSAHPGQSWFSEQEILDDDSRVQVMQAALTRLGLDI